MPPTSSSKTRIDCEVFRRKKSPPPPGTLPSAVSRAGSCSHSRTRRSSLFSRASRIAISGGACRVSAHDWPYFAEQVRRREYDVDANEVRPYFELDRVLHDGVFFAATSLFGLQFRKRDDFPVYHPDVHVYEVVDHDGSPLGL